MNDYTKFDALLIATIRATKTATGRAEFSDIAYQPNLMAMAASLAKADNRGQVPGWRITDRRLQSMRKAGKLTFDRKNGWAVA